MTTFRVSKWAPANETSAMLQEERFNYVGNCLGALGYGVHATLYAYTLVCLFYSMKRRDRRRRGWIVIVYITINFIIGSIGNIFNIIFNEKEFIDDRDFPGGPVAFSRAEDSNLLNSIGFSLFIVNAWLQDGLLIYRFRIIVTPAWWLLSIPCLSYLASIIMSILLLVQFTGHAAGFFSHAGVNFGLAFWSTSIATTIFITTLIVARLLILRHQIRKVLKSTGNGIYVSLSTVCIESAILYTSVALIFVVNYARNSPATELMLPYLGQVQSITPLLITLALAQGRALTGQTMKDTLAEIESGIVIRPQSSNLSEQHSTITAMGTVTGDIEHPSSTTTPLSEKPFDTVV